MHGVDLADARDETLRAELRHALAEFQVLFFRKQTLTPDQQLAVAKVFGDPDCESVQQRNPGPIGDGGLKRLVNFVDYRGPYRLRPGPCPTDDFCL